jgi:tetratricopeptide (TPR) repeat protein
VALLALKLLEPKELFHALKEQIRQRVVACFDWTDGNFQLVSEAPADIKVQPLRCDPFELVHTGLTRHWGAERMLESLAPHLNRYAKPSAAYIALTRRIQPHESVVELVASLDGAKTVGHAMGAKGSQPETLAAAWMLVSTPFLRFSDAPISDGLDEASEAPSLDIEIEISGGEASNKESTPKPGQPKIAKPSTSDDERMKQAGAMRTEILAKLEDLADLEHYAVLGVDADANSGAIKRAYLKAAKRYHPDSLARLALQDMKVQASEVFARIAEAYEVLSDSDKRAQYDDSLLDDGPAIDAAVIAQAETFYRKGQILLGMGDFRGALEYLKNAVEIWPEENAYQSDLGWAYYKKSPSEPEPARLHLEHALELNPSDPVGHFRLGLVLRALGETDSAQSYLARAKNLDPKGG